MCVFFEGPSRTRLQCPLCGLDVLEQDGDLTKDCPVHQSTLLFSQSDTGYILAAKEALARIHWWTPQEKSEFLEVLCGVAGVNDKKKKETKRFMLFYI